MLGERFDQALLLAADLHRHQRRKASETPYVSHLLAVAALVLEHGADEETAIAALLHDAVEDQGGEPTRARIEREFGPRVAAIVMECTDTMIQPKPAWQPRKQAYIDHLRVASPEARLVSMADKLHNARSIVIDHRRLGPEVWTRFSASRERVCWYYTSIVAVLRQVDRRPLVDLLAATVDELVRLD